MSHVEYHPTKRCNCGRRAGITGRTCWGCWLKECKARNKAEGRGQKRSGRGSRFHEAAPAAVHFTEERGTLALTDDF
jgi:hypothetical protein